MGDVESILSLLHDDQFHRFITFLWKLNIFPGDELDIVEALMDYEERHETYGNYK